MKIVSYRTADGASFGMIRDGRIVDLGRMNEATPTLEKALALGALQSLADHAGSREGTIAFEDADLLPVVPRPSKIICVGLNYATHIAEGGREPPKYPMLFVRFPNSQVGHRQSIIRPKISETLDFEGEMAFIVGKSARGVKAADAHDVVAGYACYNDGSVREWQRHTAQFTPGKNFFRTGGFGPWMTTPDEAGDITKATLVTRLNGEEMQRATVDDLVFGVPELVEYITSFTMLEPGDVVVTGTTGGVGAYRKPPVWMKPGDTVEVEVTGLGTLVNTVVDEI